MMTFMESLAGLLLDERGLSMQVHQLSDGWVVWLYAPEDAVILCVGEGPRLSVALGRALDKWDRAGTPAGGGS